jgi:hypothetical protein
VTDCVNDSIDTRIQSKAADGALDEVLKQVSGNNKIEMLNYSKTLHKKTLALNAKVFYCANY